MHNRFHRYILRLTTPLLLLAMLLPLACCHDQGEEPQPPRPPRPEVADQTILFYLAGTSLGSYFRTNVLDMTRAIEQDILGNSRILVFSEPQRDLSLVMELSYDYEQATCRIDTLRRWEMSDFNSMAPQTITEVVGYMTEQAPAHRYGMVMGGHGLGWVPKNTPYSAAAVEFDLWQKIPGALPTRSRHFGEGSETCNIPEMAAAFTATGVHFDYLIFDACFMSSIETLYDLRHCTTEVVASPCEIMAAGFPYELLLPALLTDGGRSYDLNEACNRFYRYYRDVASMPSACIARTVCAELEALAEVVTRIEATASYDYDPDTLQYYEGMRRHIFYDLRDYLEAICTDPALLEEFDRQFAAAVPESSRLHTEYYYSAYGMGGGPEGMHTITSYSGVTTGAPCERLHTEWLETEWAKATGAK